MTSIGNRLKELRERNNLSIDEISSFLGIQKKNYNKFEEGRSIPTIKQFKKLGKKYKINYKYIIFDSYKPREINKKLTLIITASILVIIILICNICTTRRLSKYIENPIFNITEIYIEKTEIENNKHKTYVYKIDDSYLDNCTNYLHKKYIRKTNILYKTNNIILTFKYENIYLERVINSNYIYDQDNQKIANINGNRLINSFYNYVIDNDINLLLTNTYTEGEYL